jgi:hypothetical protein
MLPNLKSIDFFFNELEDSAGSDNASDLGDTSDSKDGINSALVSSSPGVSDINQQENSFIAALKKQQNSNNDGLSKIQLDTSAMVHLILCWNRHSILII